MDPHRAATLSDICSKRPAARLFQRVPWLSPSPDIEGCTPALNAGTPCPRILSGGGQAAKLWLSGQWSCPDLVEGNRIVGGRDRGSSCRQHKQQHPPGSCPGTNATGPPKTANAKPGEAARPGAEGGPGRQGSQVLSRLLDPAPVPGLMPSRRQSWGRKCPVHGGAWTRGCAMLDLVARAWLPLGWVSEFHPLRGWLSLSRARASGHGKGRGSPNSAVQFHHNLCSREHLDSNDNPSTLTTALSSQTRGNCSHRAGASSPPPPPKVSSHLYTSGTMEI